LTHTCKTNVRFAKVQGPATLLSLGIPPEDWDVLDYLF
jgi:hypothetical protein